MIINERERLNYNIKLKITELMKKPLTVLLSVASALLTVGFVSCNSTTPANETATTATAATATTTTVAGTNNVAPTPASTSTIPVAYINIDSLVSSYDLYTELRSAYETKMAKTEKELTSKGRSFEKEVLEFQEKVQKGLVTRSQATTMEQALQKKQQALVASRDALLQEMAEEERVMLNNIQYNIVEYLKEFNANKRYGVILSTTTAGPILNADPSLNITSQIIEGLNKKHIAEKKK